MYDVLYFGDVRTSDYKTALFGMKFELSFKDHAILSSVKATVHKFYSKYSVVHCTRLLQQQLITTHERPL